MAELALRLRRTQTKLQSFNIAKGMTEFEVHFDDGVSFGILDQHNSGTLDKIVDYPLVQMNGQAEANAIKSVINKAPKASDAVIRIDIDIYGPMSLSEEVGTSLSVRKAWLQRPNAPKFPYRNPQTIAFKNMTAENIRIPNNLIQAKERSTRDFRKSITEIYSTLRRDKDLSRVQGDVGLRTHLLE